MSCQLFVSVRVGVTNAKAYAALVTERILFGLFIVTFLFSFD